MAYTSNLIINCPILSPFVFRCMEWERHSLYNAGPVTADAVFRGNQETRTANCSTIAQDRMALQENTCCYKRTCKMQK